VKFYDKRDDFNFSHCENSIGTLIRYSRDFDSYHDFLDDFFSNKEVTEQRLPCG
jgi:hypothetical protein